MSGEGAASPRSIGPDEELPPLPALCAALARGELSSRQLLARARARSEAREGYLNIIAEPRWAQAEAEAAERDREQAEGQLRGPLHGLPLTVKDVFQVEGLLDSKLGVPGAPQRPAGQSATLVQRLQDAGAVIFGRSNAPLASYDWQCHNPVKGATSNPHHPSHTPGGSSGGSAAALAAGYTALELGSDVGGSIRVPAHFCGVSGIRPTEGRLSEAGHAVLPDQPHTLRSMAVAGPMTRTLEELAWVFPLLEGPDPRRWQNAPFEEEAPGPIDPGQLRIAWWDDFGVPLEPETRAALMRTVEALKAAGARVERVFPAQYTVDEALDIWGLVQGAENRAVLPLGGPPPLSWLAGLTMYLRFGGGSFAQGLWRGFVRGSIRGYMEALTRRDDLVRRSEDFLQRFDGWLLPVAAGPAFPQQWTGRPIPLPVSAAEERAGVQRRVPYTDFAGRISCATAVLGCPMVTWPVAMHRYGLPIGLQLAGARWTDRRLIEVARAIEGLMAERA